MPWLNAWPDSWPDVWTARDASASHVSRDALARRPLASELAGLLAEPLPDLAAGLAGADLA